MRPSEQIGGRGGAVVRPSAAGRLVVHLLASSLLVLSTLAGCGWDSSGTSTDTENTIVAVAVIDWESVRGDMAAASNSSEGAASVGGVYSSGVNLGGNSSGGLPSSAQVGSSSGGIVDTLVLGADNSIRAEFTVSASHLATLEMAMQNQADLIARGDPLRTIVVGPARGSPLAAPAAYHAIDQYDSSSSWTAQIPTDRPFSLEIRDHVLQASWFGDSLDLSAPETLPDSMPLRKPRSLGVTFTLQAGVVPGSTRLLWGILGLSEEPVAGAEADGPSSHQSLWGDRFTLSGVPSNGLLLQAIPLDAAGSPAAAPGFPNPCRIPVRAATAADRGTTSLGNLLLPRDCE